MAPSCHFGQNVEDYEILNLLGKGGFAVVYNARCRKTKKIVALKMINKNLIQHAGLANRVRQEVEIHSRLKHHAVLELYTFFQDANHVYLVLEWAQNGELHRYIKEKLCRPMTESEAANILYQVVEGLLYLHSHNIIHRDISLSNLLLTDTMQVKIADFGLATQLKQPNERHTTMCGTPNYISPEVVSRSSHGLTADIWSLGCMFYSLLMGRPPFDTDEVQSTLTKVVVSHYELPDHLSYEARDLIEKLLRKTPNERIPLEKILQHPFMKRYKSYSFADSTGRVTKYNKSTASSDSGIVTTSSVPSSHAHMLPCSNFADTRWSDNHCNTDPFDYATRTCNSHNYKPANNIYHEREAVQTLPTFETPENKYTRDWFSDVNTLHSETNDSGTIGKSRQNYEMKPSRPPELYCTQETRNTRDRDVAIQSTNTSKFTTLEPLSTKRLLPTRYKTKNAVMSILSNGDVVVELLKYKAKFNEVRVIDVCSISADGLRVEVFQPDPGRGIPLRDQPPQLPADINCSYSFYNLPEKHRKKYAYAARFVNLVKRKTPKITYFTDKAKCHLMESMDDFEAIFYNGAKVVRSNDGIQVCNQQGFQIQDHSNALAETLISHEWECFKRCQKICAALDNVDSNGIPCFPIVAGRRPTNQFQQDSIFGTLSENKFQPTKQITSGLSYTKSAAPLFPIAEKGCRTSRLFNFISNGKPNQNQQRI